MALCLLGDSPTCTNISQACSPCCLSMSTVKATPGICQRGAQGAADRATCLLNTIAKWGTTTAAVFTCRPVTTSGNRTTIGTRGAGTFAGMGSNFTNFLVLAVIVFVIYMVLEQS